MKIAFDYQIFLRHKFSGISRYYVRLAQKITDLGEDVRIFAPLYRNRYLKKLPPHIVNGHFIRRYPPLTKNNLFTAYNSYFAKAGIVKWEPDIIHETYYSPDQTYLKSCPTVITIHDMIHELFPEQFPASDKTSQKKAQAVKKADHIICVSECTRSDLIRLFNVPKEKTSVIYHGFNSFGQSEKNKSFNYVDSPFLLFVGDRGAHKNFKRLLESIGTSDFIKNNFKLVLFGGGNLNVSESRLISKLHLSDTVLQFSGDDKVLSSFYKNASALVYPSLYEGFGFPPLEAMANACPVIASNAGSIPEVVGNAGEFFNPLDIDSIRTSLEKVLHSEQLKKDLVEKGFERLKFFSWEKCAEETLQVYKNLVS